MTIQGFDCDIKYNPGVDNIVADGFTPLAHVCRSKQLLNAKCTTHKGYTIRKRIHHVVQRTLDKLDAMGLY